MGCSVFIDEAEIEVIAGDGGNGCFSYERLKYKPKGRPDGGDGGRGGHIYFVASPQVHTLQDVAYHQRYQAERGAHGRGKDQAGKNGKDVEIPVPLGTLVYNLETNELLFDCIEPTKKYLVAKGGRGGRGNGSLANPRNPNPPQCEAGKKGERKKVKLVLKILADVGLVGRPNAGKSTLLSCISHARPKIADYPFTTKHPHLGIVKIPGTFNSMVVADIPGIIEDCHLGKGLGIQFLRHIERTKVLAILVEAISPDPQKEAEIILKELGHYSKELLEKPRLFILTKKDLISESEKISIPKGWEIISAVTGEGLDKIIWKLYEMVKGVS
ncbi:MAG: GTPase ObgE [Chitinispirillaceae bacterium]|nr:GTPase ObgE [Chitinispirillaceae bacterium]